MVYDLCTLADGGFFSFLRLTCHLLALDQALVYQHLLLHFLIRFF